MHVVVQLRGNVRFLSCILKWWAGDQRQSRQNKKFSAQTHKTPTLFNPFIHVLNLTNSSGCCQSICLIQSLNSVPGCFPGCFHLCFPGDCSSAADAGGSFLLKSPGPQLCLSGCSAGQPSLLKGALGNPSVLTVCLPNQLNQFLSHSVSHTLELQLYCRGLHPSQLQSEPFPQGMGHLKYSSSQELSAHWDMAQDPTQLSAGQGSLWVGSTIGHRAVCKPQSPPGSCRHPCSESLCCPVCLSGRHSLIMRKRLQIVHRTFQRHWADLVNEPETQIRDLLRCWQSSTWTMKGKHFGHLCEHNTLS